MLVRLPTTNREQLPHQTGFAEPSLPSLRSNCHRCSSNTAIARIRLASMEPPHPPRPCPAEKSELSDDIAGCQQQLLARVGPGEHRPLAEQFEQCAHLVVPTPTRLRSHRCHHYSFDWPQLNRTPFYESKTQSLLEWIMSILGKIDSPFSNPRIHLQDLRHAPLKVAESENSDIALGRVHQSMLGHSLDFDFSDTSEPPVRQNLLPLPPNGILSLRFSP